MAKKLSVELTKSLIGTSPYQKKVVKALGLGKMHSVVELDDTPQVRGAIEKVKHLLTVKEN